MAAGPSGASAATGLTWADRPHAARPARPAPPGRAGRAQIRQDGRMASYAQFAGFYDQIMGDRSEDIWRIRRTIERFMPGARSLLELGCGTGAMLAGLADDLAVTGVDASPEMLAIAAGKVPGARLVQ